MATLPGIKLSKGTVSQRLNLEEILGVSFKGDRSLKLAIAQKLIDHISERTTERNVDVDGRQFKKYSKSYKESTVFRLLKDGDDPDLKLTGNMLGDLDVISDKGSIVEIGLTDETEILKAFNHNTGDTLPKRAWFGVTKAEIQRIVRDNFKSDIDALKKGDARSESTANKRRLEAADRAGQGRVRTVSDIVDGDDGD